MHESLGFRREYSHEPERAFSLLLTDIQLISYPNTKRGGNKVASAKLASVKSRDIETNRGSKATNVDVRRRKKKTCMQLYSVRREPVILNRVAFLRFQRNVGQYRDVTE